MPARRGFKGAVDEGAEVPAVDVFVGGFAGGVVAAGEDARDVVDREAKVVEDFEGVPGEEGQVVGGMDDERFARRGGGEAIHEGHGADRGQDLPDLILRQAGSKAARM